MCVGVLVFVAALALASAGRWHQQSNGTIDESANDISYFTKNKAMLATNNIIAGYNLDLSSDGGKNWATADFSLISSLDSTAAMTRTVGIVCGDYGVSYTKNAGQTFNVTADSANLSGCQSAATFWNNSGVAVIGFLGNNEVAGVALSSDGGVNFKIFNASSVITVGPYDIAFPSATTWYVSCGEELVGESRKHSASKTARRAARVARGSTRRARALQMPPTLFYGQIAKTEDGGATWKLVYNPVQGQETQLGIDCSSVNDCCVASVTYDSTNIRCTNDGGATWPITYENAGTSLSLEDVIYVKSSGWWVTGGGFNSTDPYGYAVYLNSADGAKWTVDTLLPGLYGVSLDTPADGSGALFGLALSASLNDDGLDHNVVMAGQ